MLSDKRIMLSVPVALNRREATRDTNVPACGGVSGPPYIHAEKSERKRAKVHTCEGVDAVAF